jgi:S-adenosylhomocysteine hydrolase
MLRTTHPQASQIMSRVLSRQPLGKTVTGCNTFACDLNAHTLANFIANIAIASHTRLSTEDENVAVLLKS